MMQLVVLKLPEVIKPTYLSVQAAETPKLYDPPVVELAVQVVTDTAVALVPVVQAAAVPPPALDIFQLEGSAVPAEPMLLKFSVTGVVLGTAICALPLTAINRQTTALKIVFKCKMQFLKTSGFRWS